MSCWVLLPQHTRIFPREALASHCPIPPSPVLPLPRARGTTSIISREREAMGNKYSVDNRVVGKGVPKKRPSAKGTKRTPPYVSLLECACLLLYQELIYYVCVCVSVCECRPSPVNRSPSAAAQGKENAAPTQPPSTNIWPTNAHCVCGQMRERKADVYCVYCGRRSVVW